MRYHEPNPPTLGDCLLDVYFIIFWNLLNIFLKSFEIFKKFIILLCYILDKKFAKKCVIVIKIQVHLQFHLLFKSTSYNVFKKKLGVFNSLDPFQFYRIYIPIY
jgi:hypothetical protein